MPMYAPALDQALRKYIRSSDYTELNDEAISVVKAIKSNAYNDVRSDLQLILVKISLKAYYLEFLTTTPTADQTEKLKQKVAQMTDAGAEAGFDHPVRWGKTIYGIIERTYPIVKEQSARSALISCWEDDPGAVSVAQIDEALAGVRAGSRAVDELPEETVFEPFVKAADYRQLLFDRFRRDEERLLTLRDRKKSGLEKQLIEKYLFPLEQKYPLSFDYVPGDDPFRQRANVLILHTPIVQEAALIVTEYGKINGTPFSVLDLHQAGGSVLSDLPELLRIAGERKIHLFVEGIGDVFDKKEKKERKKEENDKEREKEVAAEAEILFGFLRVGKAGAKVVLVDVEGSNDLYERIIRLTAATEDLSILDISYDYLTMPKYDELIRLLIGKGLIDSIDGPDAERIKNGMPFLGFVGLTGMLRAALTGKNIFAVGCAISQKNDTPLLREYLARIPNLARFIDSGWGNVFERKANVVDGRPEFDYDAIRDVKIENIKKIVNYPCDYFAKGGLLVRYSLLGGDGKEKWQDLSDEERAKRIENAVDLVFLLFGIGFFPKVEITDKMGSKFAGGLCIDKGKIIRFKKSCITNYEWLAECILHESFHAFQHKTIDSRFYYKWYWTELGVKPERIAQWALNHQTYISPERTEQINAATGCNIDYYRLQIFEAEAFAFEVDAVRAGDEIWNLLDLK